jgi:predicted RNase H-like nuclease (RuvC/YqgF family)
MSQDDEVLRAIQDLARNNQKQLEKELVGAKEAYEAAVKLESRLTRMETAISQLNDDNKDADKHDYEDHSFRLRLENRLTKIEGMVSDLGGNGKPGRVGKLEDAVSELKQWRWSTVGYASGVSGAIAVLAYFINHVWK